jgi:hypothetical protein
VRVMRGACQSGGGGMGLGRGESAAAVVEKTRLAAASNAAVSVMGMRMGSF